VRKDESWPLTISFASSPPYPGYVLTGAQAFYWGVKAIRGWRRRRAAPAPHAMIERAKKLRQEILEHTRSLPENQFLEIIIHDVARWKVFPEIDARNVGVSAWYKADLHGVYYNGIEVFLGEPQKAIQAIDPDDRFGMIWKLLQPGDDPAGAVTAFPIGRIPFDSIESIDWHPDEFWGCPHFYCRYAGPIGGPAEDVIYVARLYPDVSSAYLAFEGLRPCRFQWSRPRQLAYRKLWEPVHRVMRRWRRD
jgi:hypothetical protein